MKYFQQKSDFILIGQSNDNRVPMKVLAFVVIAMLLVSLESSAQYSGPQSVEAGSTHDYIVDYSLYSGPGVWVTNGTVQSTVYRDFSGGQPTNVQLTIQWSGIESSGCICSGPVSYYVTLLNPSPNFRFEPDNSENYVASQSFRVEISDENSLPEGVGTSNNIVTYYDGLGRPKQQVQHAASPQGFDIIVPIYYDEYGRTAKKYLPFTSSNNFNGGYMENALTGQEGFYNDRFGGSAGDYAFSETKFEPSPLNRVEKTLAPGAAWVGADRGVTTTYETNNSNEIYRLFVASNGLISTSGSIYYGAGQLYKTATVDEDENKVVEYTDKQGQVVCKKAYLDESTNDFAATYYLYDDFGLLRYVVQPQGVDDMGTDLSLLNDMDFRDKWMFQYTYDERKRMIVKKVPGAEPVYMIYDKRDRLVLTQDGNQRGVEVKSLGSIDYETDQYEWTNYDISSTSSVTLKPGFSFKANPNRSFYAGQNATAVSGKWTYTKYDVLNRPVMTGIVTLSGSRESIQRSITYDSSHPFTETYEGNTADDLYGYDNNGYPSSVASSTVLTVTYYDSYNFVNNLSWGSGYTNSGHNTKVRGQVTGSQVRKLGGGMLKSVTYYDSRLRPIKNIDQNHLGGTDKVTTTYANLVSPRVTSTVRTHTASGQPTLTITENYTYDHMDRLLTTTHKINSQGTVTLHENDYNEIGELIEKDLRGSASPVQSVDYKYNIRGWLTHINNGTSFDFGENDKFGMELRYDAAGKYNGNIGKMLWKTAQGSGVEAATQTYDFSYDKLNRLTGAAYNSGLPYAGLFYVNGITYDLNGNIGTLNRHGKFVGGDDDLMDQLTYYYNGNQLTSVEDARPYDRSYDTGFTEEYSEDNQPNEYLYDANGNMISDANKGITNINYNYLNLPESVTTPDGTISYTYDASGMKLRKFYDRTSGTDETTDYVGGIQYKDGVQDFIQHAEGRALKSGSTFSYEYNLTDHLGNVRVTVNSAGSVIQRDDYYPFGLTFNSYASGQENLYKFTGKEEQPELGWIDFEARMYNASLGRWNSIDPLAGLYFDMSPYHYALNNPIVNVDPTGMNSVNLKDLFDNAPSGKSSYDGDGNCTCGCPGTPDCPDEEEQEQVLDENTKTVTGLQPGQGVKQDGTVYNTYHQCDENCTLDHFTDADMMSAFGEVALIFVGGQAFKLVFRGGKWVLRAVKGVNIKNAKWAQTTFSNVFSKTGKFAGKTVDDVASALKSGSLKADDVPIDVITRDGNVLILNTRSSAALTKAGIPRSQWKIVNRTGQEAFEKRLTDQLSRNSLGNSGTNVIRQSGTKNVITN